MLIRRPPEVRASEITPREIYESRRRFLALGAAGAGAVLLGAGREASAAAAPAPLGALKPSPLSTDEPPTPKDKVTRYNNFYEFGVNKEDPAVLSQDFEPRPWTVEVTGECAKPGRIDVDALIAPHALEERIYRLRCVEAWSMVVPWVGIPLGAVLARFEPTSGARYVEFTTLLDPERMPGQSYPVLDWPYREGLRMDEAMHPLAILAVGLYGEVLPNQNGAPLRLVVPWKYGFKSIKSIVRIRFAAQQPATSWNVSAPSEYGFYANVNPAHDHPRWSQARERRIGEFFKRDTLPFNGYAEQVASLYAGQDLHRDF